MALLIDDLGAFADGWLLTLAISLLAFPASLIVGIVICSARVSPFPALRAGGMTFVELVRNSPLPAIILLFWFGAPKVGIDIPRLVAAVLVMSLYTSAHVAEAIRAGILSVPVSQIEAGRSLGLTVTQNLRLVVLPQSLRTVIQPLGNIWIALIKNSAAVSFIAVPDLTYRATQVSTNEAEPIAALLGAAAGYVLLTLPSGIAAGALERRLAIRR